MSIDPVSEALWNQIRKEVEKEDIKTRKFGYWMLCPSCGKRVVEKELIKKGCYVCGWQGTEHKIKTQVEQSSQVKEQTSTVGRKENIHSYRTNCPKCGNRVVTEQLVEKGCYICGWKPEDRKRRTEDRKSLTSEC